MASSHNLDGIGGYGFDTLYASSTSPSTTDITMAEATTDTVMSDATGDDPPGSDEDLSTHKVIYDPIVDQSWLLKCHSTDLTRPQLCTCLSFANTQELHQWEQALDTPRRRSAIHGWVIRQPLLYIIFGVEEILKILCNANGPTLSLQKIERIKR
jgi:hypothetical protein